MDKIYPARTRIHYNNEQYIATNDSSHAHSSYFNCLYSNHAGTGITAHTTAESLAGHSHY